MEITVDISATLAPKLSVPRPSGDSTTPVNATFSCQAPWDIDDNLADNTHELVLSTKPNIIPVSSNTVYAIGTSLLIIAVLWLLGIIKPASLQPLATAPRKQNKKVKQQTRPKPQPKVAKKESSIQLEEDTLPTSTEEDADVTEIQESLIEIEEAEPEPPEEELDEFELRLKQLRDRRR
jgi:hypothetical protein